MLKRAAFVLVALAVLGLGLLPWAAEAQTPPPETSSLLVKLVPGLTADQQAAVIARNGGTETGAIPALRLHVVEVLTVELADTIARYEADAQVQHVEENRVRRSEMLSNDTLAVDQWALPQIGWDLVFGTIVPTGTAKVAILDSGIDASHPDLASRVVAGISILDGSDGRTDSYGHGTQVAGIVAANTDNAAGVAGVAFAGVQLMPVTVLDANGEGRDSDVIAGVIWAADNGADVILMAFSNPGFSPNLQDAIDYAWSRGAVLVAAVGNDGVGTPTFPAGDRGVIGVSATDPADALEGWSNYGQAAFLAAPGNNIITTVLGGGYDWVGGTSSSAAIVAGVAAFLKAVDPTLTNGMIVGRMARTADPAGTHEQTGNGRVNLARALTDTGRDEIQPAGADPVGDGGPFVGPYRAAGNSTVSGVVRDSVTTLGIAGATVSCSNVGTNPCNSAVSATTSSGPVPPVGSYTLGVNFSGNSNTVRLTASAPGYLSASADVAVSNTTNPTQNFSLTRATATLIVKKVMVGGTGTFNFTGTPNGSISANNGTLTASNVAPGTYTSTETVPAGWDLTTITCDDTDSTGDVPSKKATFQAAAGETITCTFTNVKRGHLIVQKTTDPAGDTTTFSITASGTGTITGGGAGSVTDATDKDYEVTPGTYSVTETVPAGWDKTGDTCQNVVVGAGETKTCLLTNVKRGHLIVQKTTDPAGDTTTFSITASGTGTITGGGAGTVTDATDHDYEVTPGTYSVTETVPVLWAMIDNTCVNVTVAAGGSVSCKITNVKRLPAKVTGGGQITTNAGGRASFGFDAERKVLGGPTKGNFNYVDQAGNVHINGPVIDVLGYSVGSNAVTFWGTCGGTCTFMVTVEDFGEPGSADTFEIQVSTGYEQLERVISRGNIQRHK